MSRPHSAIEIRLATPPERVAALSWVLADVPEAETQARQLLATLAHEAWRGLYIAHQGDDVLGAVWLQEIGGDAGMIWPPRGATLAVDTAERLVTAALDAARQRKLQLVQALLAGDADADTALLMQQGFRRLADLAYLACRVDSLTLPAVDTRLTFTPCADCDTSRLTKIVDATYRNTLDLPELNGLRSAAEVLAEYRTAPQHDPQLWFLVGHEGRDVGCLLLNDHATNDQMELVYFGLTPEARGHGWGREIVRYAQHTTRRLGRRQMLLAVSADNRPALDTYAACGFFAWQQRRTLVHWLDESRPSRK